MHRLLEKLKPASNETRRGQEPRQRAATADNGHVPSRRGRRSLNEAAHKLHH
jgi:hypothetical protein